MSVSWWENLWLGLYWCWIWPMCKWVLRKMTGKCELLRIMYGNPPGPRRTKMMEKSLQRSQSRQLRRLVVEEKYAEVDAAMMVMKVKSVSPELHSQFVSALQGSLQYIRAYSCLYSEVECVRKIAYSSHNTDHEQLLLQLWSFLKAKIPLKSRITEQWTEIGFQSSDPQTDFRGMGVLGLYQLVYFAEKYTDISRHVLSRSNHPTIWYPYAIAGINITSMLFTMLKKGKLKVHFYNLAVSQTNVKTFHELYCYTVYEFDKFWFDEKPRDVMEFNRIKEKFRQRFTKHLKESDCSFRLHIP